MSDDSVTPEKRSSAPYTRKPVGHDRFFSHSIRLFQHHIPTEFVLLGVIEFIVLVASFYLGIQFRFEYGWAQNLDWHGFRAIAFAMIMQVSLVAFGVYQRQSSLSLNLLAVRVAAGLLLGIVVLGVMYYTIPSFLTGRGALALAVLVSFVGIMAVRLVFIRIANAYDLRLRVLVLGAGRAARLIRDAESMGEIGGINILAYMPMPGDIQESKSIGVSNTPGALVNYISGKNVDVIVLAMDERRSGVPDRDLLDCKMSGIEVIDLQTFFERFTNKIRLDILQPSWLFLSDGFQVNTFKRMWKRIFDITAVLLLLPVVLPLCVICMIAVIAESRFRGSVLYSQTRVGENNKQFQIYKFRSMVVDAERDGIARWASKGDARITRVGAYLRKFRLDEMPQLFNILKGDMSFVGPRPERPEFVERLAERIPYYNERHRVKPGLTGWAQIRYPYGASEEDGLEKFQYDLYYVKNYSILMDAVVLLQTAEVVILGRGAN